MILQPLRTLLLVALFACASMCLADAPPFEGDAASQREREALLAFLKKKGVELRAAESRSNVISHIYSVGPEHTKQYLVGLTYHPRALSYAEVIVQYPIALPFAMNNHWVLWQIGGPRGNATKDYLVVWERACRAFKDYPA